MSKGLRASVMTRESEAWIGIQYRCGYDLQATALDALVSANPVKATINLSNNFIIFLYNNNIA